MTRRTITFNAEVFNPAAVAVYTVAKAGPRWAIYADGDFCCLSPVNTKAAATVHATKLAAGHATALEVEAEAQAIREAAVAAYLAVRRTRPVQLRLF